MKILGPCTLADILMEWGLQDARGRLSGKLSHKIVDELAGPESQFTALGIILHARLPLIVSIIAAVPENCIRAEVLPNDLSVLRVLGNPPKLLVTSFENNKSQDLNWIKSLTNREMIDGPLLAIARDDKGPFTLFDGVHRAMAWYKHSLEGKNYPVALNAIFTRHPVRNWE